MTNEFKNKEKNDLEKTLHDKQKQLQNFHFVLSGSKAKNVREGRSTRKDIARIMTELRTIKK